MTLEDFFTLSELKDGLTSPDRVKELITVMQRENNSVVKNFAESNRQRSTVATTLAATENKNCLDLFIYLNGLHFIDRWLKDAQKLGNDSGNGFFEELIIALLRALEKLQIDNQSSSAFEIAKTVQNLVSHRSSVVCDRAKMLCDQWVLIQHSDSAPRDDKNLDDDNNEKNVENPGDETEPLDHVDRSSKSTNEDRNLLVKFEVPDSKSEGIVFTEKYGSTPIAEGGSCVGESDVSRLDTHVKDENEVINMEMSTLSSRLDVENVWDSSRKTDPKGDEDEEMMDDEESSNRFPTTMPLKNTEAESLKTSSNSQSETVADDAKKHGSQFFKISMNSRDDGVKSDILDMECGMIDPMEVARRVSIEVRREFDSRERSCSTSEKTSTPDSTNRKEIPPIDGSDKEVTSGSEKTSSGGASEPVKDPETLVSEREICKTDVTVSQVSEIAQESEANTGFDLNQEVCSEEVDNPINPVSSTISVVSASRAVPASGLPATPLQFEGTLGWKGSASTSAFRRISDSFSTHNKSKQRLDCLDIDLNVNEEESSVEASPRRPERMQFDFDLNSIGDEIADPAGFDSRQDLQSPSRSSSSSSKKPSLRNIDLNLNDQPVFPSGRIAEPQVDFDFRRSGFINYGNPPVYGNNGFASGSAAMFFYGSPYMVDSRGAPVGPQITGSGQPQSTFVTNPAAAGSSSGSSQAGPTLHNFDLNTGLVVDGGNRNPIGGSMDEQYSGVKKSFQGSSSCVVGGKRQEPDAARWELFPVNKHPQRLWR